MANSIVRRHDGERLRRLMLAALVILALLATSLPVEAATTYTTTLDPVSDDNIQIAIQTGSSTHWNQVLSTSTDSTYVATTSSTWQRDRYNLADFSSSPGTIVSVTVHIRAGHNFSWTAPEPCAGTYVRTAAGVEQFGTAVTIPNPATSHPTDWSWGEYSTTYTTVPGTSSAWTWTDINGLQVGVSLKDSGTKADATSLETRCSKVWVTVEYRAPFTTTPSSLTTTEGGTPASFSIRLDTKPTASVTIGLSSSDTSEGTVSPASVTFTADAAATPITRRPSGNGGIGGDWSGSDYTKVNDQSDSTYALGQDTNSYGQAWRLYTFPSFGLPSNSKNISLTVYFRAREGQNQAVRQATVRAAILVGGLLRVSDTSWHPPNDEDSYGQYSFTWSTNPYNSPNPGWAWTVDEINGVSTFGNQPLTEIGVYASDLDPDVRFSEVWAVVNYTVESNYNIPQTVTVTPVDDLIADGNVTYAIVTAAAVSTDPYYSGWNPDDVTVTNNDNDTSGIVVSPASLTTAEGGSNAQFTVKLNSEPTANVTVNLSSSDTTEGTVSPSSLTFLAPYNGPGYQQRVPTGVYGTGGGTWTPHGAINLYWPVDDSPYITDPAQLDSDYITSPLNASGGWIAFSYDDFDIPSNATNISVSVTFRAKDAVTTGTNDLRACLWIGGNPYPEPESTNPGANFGLGGHTWSMNPGYGGSGLPWEVNAINGGGFCPRYFGVYSSDMDPAIAVSHVYMTVHYNYTIAPNWSVPQTVTVTPVDEWIDDGNIAYTINLSATGGDYAGKTATVNVTNNDNDTASFTVNPTSGLITTESGGTATFSIKMNSQPTADVTINLSSSDATEGSVTPTSVTFTPSMWGESWPKTITVTGLDDAIDDGDIGYTIVTSAAISTDPVYNGMNPPDVTVTNRDNDDANTAPVLAPIGNRAVNEGTLLSFTASATDANTPAQTLTFSLIGAPTGAVINATSGAFTWTPTEAQGPGSYPFTVKVTDSGTPALSDEEAITVTVNEVNVAPVLGAIGNKSVNELATLSFTATATDADSPSQTLTYSLDAASLTAGMTINGSTGAFSWTPTEAQDGGYAVTITVTDNGTPTLNDSETITITVNEVNVAPVLGAIGNKSVDELATLTFTATATDADLPAQTLTYSLVGAPTGALINATSGAFSWTPTEAQGPGSYTFTVKVTDNGTPTLSDEEEVTVTVNEVAEANVAPVLNEVGNKTVDELNTLNFTATATDANVPSQTLTYSLDAASLAAGMTINGTTGAFSWTPTEAQDGSHSVTITVTDNGTPPLNDSETITITVNEVNVAPVLGAIGDKSVDELATLSFTATATDADLPSQTLTYSLVSAPTGALISATSGAFTWTPTEAQGPGSYTFDVVVSDGSLTDTETISVTVNEVNTAPVLDSVGNKTVDEGSLLSFTASAADSDQPAQTLTFSIVDGPTGATIGSTSGAFSWTPTETQGPGSYTFAVVVSDGELSDSETIMVTVSEVNVAPVLEAIGNQTVNEGNLLSLTAMATDSDVPANELTYSASGLPTGATFDPATRTFAWTPTEAQGPGSYTVTIKVTDAPGLFDEESFTITVNEANLAPVLGAIGNQTVNERSLLSFTASATDADLPAQNLTFSLVTGPEGAAIDSTTGAFSWTPTEAQGPGSYTFDVVVSDGDLSDRETITVTVSEVNEAPVLGTVGNQTVNEGDLLSFTASATDTDLPAQTLTFSLVDGPTGATIGATSGVFSWTPSEAQGPNTYTFSVVVSDGSLNDSETITVTINEVNATPVLGAIGNQTVGEGNLLSFTASATDADQPPQALTFSLVDGPTGATIGATSGVFSWTPTEAQGPGTYTFGVAVSDGSLSDSETITVTVNEVNAAPVVSGVPVAVTIPEMSPYTFTATAEDTDLPSQTLTFSLSGGPTGAVIDPTTGVFTWTPTEAQGPGTYTFDVVVSDGNLTDSETIAITVSEVNLAPVLGAIGNQTAAEGILLSFTALATDADLPSNPLTFGLVSGPAGAAIDSTTGVFTWAPTEAQGPGSYTFTVVVSDGSLSDSETITVTVNEVNAPPVLNVIGGKSVEWGNELTFTLSASDSDVPANALTYSISAGALPGMTIDPNTGVFRWTPTSSQIGSQSVTLTVTDNGVPAETDSETIAIDVQKRSTTLVYTGDVAEQYSDVASLSATLKDAASGAALAEKPVVFTAIGDVLTAVNTNSSGSAATAYTVTDAAGAFYEVISYFAGDDLYKSSSDRDAFEVMHENISGDLKSDMAYKTEPGANYTGTLTLTVWIKEAYTSATGEPNGEPLAEPGNISLANMTNCWLETITGGPITGQIKSVENGSGSGYAGYRIVTCEFTADIPVNTYSLVLPVTGDYYSGTYETVIVVYDPSLGFTTGGGWFNWPAGTANPELEGVKTNFGYTMKYNKKATSVQGSFLLIAHLPDGSIIRMKSNAIYGLAILDSAYPGKASFSGKCVYTRLDADGNVLAESGNQEFTVYVEDKDEPGTGDDLFWFTTKLTIAGEAPFSLDSNGNNKVDSGECVTLGGGNIVVPHGGESGGTTPPADKKK